MIKSRSVIGSFAAVLIIAAASHGEYYPSRFEEGYSFSVRETTLYTAPDDSSETVVVIPPGSFLEITDFADETFYADSCNWGWYEAGYRLENTEHSGFVQDRDLAYAHLSLGQDTLFVFSLSSFNTGENVFEGEISVIANGEILLTQGYRPSWTPYGRIFDYDVRAVSASSSGFTGVKSLVVFYSGLNVSGLECAEDLIAWTDHNQIVFGPRAFSMFVDEVSRTRTEIILPSTPGGEENRVTFKTVSDTYSLEIDSWIPCEDEITHFLWNGSKFEEE